MTNSSTYSKIRKGSMWSSSLVNPIHVIEYIWPELKGKLDFITYDPSLRKGQFSINLTCKHDGTMIFEDELFAKVLINVVNRQVYVPGIDRKDLKNWECDDIHYVLGPIRKTSVFGKVDVPAGRINGQRQRMRMPVISKIINLRRKEE